MKKIDANIKILYYFSLIILLHNGFGLFAQSDLRINEFMAVNDNTLTDEDGDYSDWIELYNPGPTTINLSGWTLTDDIDDPFKWTFPAVYIGVNEYLIIFASDKNRILSGSELHTNFKLSSAGEYLGLNDPSGEIISELNPFPVQTADISYGFVDSVYTYFNSPSPGSVNLISGSILPSPVFDKKHGFYETAFYLSISSEVEGTSVYYTTNGSTPNEISGKSYTAPLLIDSTTVIRAIAVKEGQADSRITTCSYFFLEDILTQPNDPEGYPTDWGPFYSIDGNITADYEMDPELIADPSFYNNVTDALKSLPTISIVSDISNFFSKSTDPETGGIYVYTGVYDGDLGRGWERPASAEFFMPGDSNSFQINCGISLNGGYSRRHEATPKHSFKLEFKSDYGSSRLNYPVFGVNGPASFNNLILRAGFNNSWPHHKSEQRERAQYIRDIWVKDTQRDMGHLATNSIFVHLYINGIYWGVYAPSERIDADFAESHLDGLREEFDVIKDNQDIIDGNKTAWNKLITMANAGLSTDAAYQAIQGNDPDGNPDPNLESMVDVVNLADYMLINFYGGNQDWDGQNWSAIRNRVNPDKGFIFVCWDGEWNLLSLSHNVVNENNNYCPSRVFTQLKQNDNFKRLFADRVQKYLYNGGLLTPDVNINRWEKRADQVQLALYGESARWGDYRRDVHRYLEAGPFDVYNVEDHWLTQKSFLLNTYFPSRTDILINQLRSAGLFPAFDAPVFYINDTVFNNQAINYLDELSMKSEEGVIYYTTTGNDPSVSSESGSTIQRKLIEEADLKKVIVPKSDLGTEWLSNYSYDDSNWLTCNQSPGGIGYEINTGYENLITLDVKDDMYSTGNQPNTSCYIRIPFQVNGVDLPVLKSLYLNVRYDDGFVAYINGTKIAESNAPSNLSWNSSATTGHEANNPVILNISEFTSLLKGGDNLLSIHALNSSITSSDFLINISLTATDGSSTEISDDAIMYSSPIILENSAHIKARTFVNGSWSALNEKFFTIPEDYNDLKITEIQYNPLETDNIDESKLEFIELKNTGKGTLDIGGLKFITGIDYCFPVETPLKSNEFVVLAGDLDEFKNRYNFDAFDAYGGKLDNGGESIILTLASGDTLSQIRYDDDYPWPLEADGTGYSIVPVKLNPSGDQNSGNLWRNSWFINGSPGRDDTIMTSVEEYEAKEDIIQVEGSYPNPFSNLTWISYSLNTRSIMDISVYNLIGQKIITLTKGYEEEGRHLISWDGLDQNGNKVNSGIYFCRIMSASNNKVSMKSIKMILIE